MFILILFCINLKLLLVSGNTYSVTIGTEHHVNVVDDRFLSFTIDPEYLFSNNEKYNSKECICMASSLTPAYIRIAGPSTSLLSFHNTTMTIDEPEPVPEPPAKKTRFHDIFSENLAKIDEVIKKPEKIRFFDRFKRNDDKLQVSHHKWKRFVKWANETGFDLVFAFNYEEKTASGLWDPNTAINIFTVAEKDNIGDMFWQLGYECKNQSIEEYLNDLETLRVVIETFPAGRSGVWKVVGGDVTGCLDGESKSDFKDYVTLSTDMMDAVLLNGKSSTRELERMSTRDRYKLLKLLSRSSTPLWLTAPPDQHGAGELARAVDSLVSLGHAARSGFTVHYTSLSDDEMYRPTLSFYMALLFKNLVGNKVLNVEMEPDQAIMFAHCTSLRHKPVPGAVTLFGVNMDDEPARFSVKLGKRDEEGDILQFVLGHDLSGNIIVNGRPMYFEGDIKPVVKRVRPYKALLINLPPKSFGFWVLANTKIDACYDKHIDKQDYNETESNEIVIQTKRAVLDKVETNIDGSFEIFDKSSNLEEENIRPRKGNLNKGLKVKDKRHKRETDTNERKFKIHNKLQQLLSRENRPRVISNLLRRNIPKLNTKRLNIRNKLHKTSQNPKKVENEHKEGQKDKVRTRRNTDQIESSKDNEIDSRGRDDDQLWFILKKIHRQLKDLSIETDKKDDKIPRNAKSEEINDKTDEIYDKTDEKYDKTDEKYDKTDEIYDETVGINNIDKKSTHNDNSEPDSSFVRSTVENLLRILADLNRNLNKLWESLNILD